MPRLRLTPALLLAALFCARSAHADPKAELIKVDGALVFLDGQHRINQVTTPDAVTTRIDYDSSTSTAISSITVTGADKVSKTWKQKSVGGGRTEVTGPDGRTFWGSIVVLQKESEWNHPSLEGVNRSRATISVSDFTAGSDDISQTISLPDGGVEAITGGGMKTTYSADGKNVSFQEMGASLGYKGDTSHAWKETASAVRDASGLSRVSANGHTWEKIDDHEWSKDGAPAIDTDVSLKNGMLVVSESAGGKRTITEIPLGVHKSVFNSDAKATSFVFRPDDNPQDRAVLAKRDEMVQAGLVPADMPLSQFREIYVEGMLAREDYLNQSNVQRLGYLNILRAARLMDSDAYDAARAELAKVEKNYFAMFATTKGTAFLPDVDPSKVDFAEFARIDSTLYDPATKTGPYTKLDSLLESYRKEIPGWGERGEAAVMGIADAMGNTVRGLVDHPLRSAGLIILTIAAPEVMVPALSAVGVGYGARTLQQGYDDIQQGKAKGDAARYLAGWRKIGQGTAEVGMSAGGALLSLKLAPKGGVIVEEPIVPVKPASSATAAKPPPEVPTYTSVRLGEPTSAQIKAIRYENRGAPLSESEARAVYFSRMNRNTKSVAVGEAASHKALGMENVSGSNMVDQVVVRKDGKLVPTEVKDQNVADLSAGSNAAMRKFQNIAENSPRVNDIDHFEIMIGDGSELEANFRVDRRGNLERLVSGTNKWEPVVYKGKPVWVRRAPLGTVRTPKNPPPAAPNPKSAAIDAAKMTDKLAANPANGDGFNGARRDSTLGAVSTAVTTRGDQDGAGVRH